MTEQYVHVDVSQNFRMSELEAAWLRLQLPRLAADNARRRAIAARATGRPRHDCGGRPTTPTTSFHLCVARVDRPRPRPRRSRRARRRDRRALPAGAHAAAGVPAVRDRGRAPTPRRGPPSASSLPCFPELTDDEVVDRRRRACRARVADDDAGNPNVRSVSAFFPCYNDERSIAGWSATSARALRDAVDDFEIIVVDDGSQRRLGRRAGRAAPSEVPELRVVAPRANRGYGGALLSAASPRPTKEWIFYTDGDAQYDAPRGRPAASTP